MSKVLLLRVSLFWCWKLLGGLGRCAYKDHELNNTKTWINNTRVQMFVDNQFCIKTVQFSRNAISFPRRALFDNLKISIGGQHSWPCTSFRCKFNKMMRLWFFWERNRHIDPKHHLVVGLWSIARILCNISVIWVTMFNKRTWRSS